MRRPPRQPRRSAEQLEQIDVTAPRRKPPARRAAPGTQPAPVPAPAPALTADEQRGANTTPLNTNVIAESASRLGLTPRETPATVEVIDQQTIREQGYRTTSEAAKGFVGVTAGEAPGAPSIISMRGFSATRSTRSTTASRSARRA